MLCTQLLTPLFYSFLSLIIGAVWVQEFLQLGFRWHRYCSQRGAAGVHGWFLTNFLINLLKIRGELIGAEDCVPGPSLRPYPVCARVCERVCARAAELGRRSSQLATQHNSIPAAATYLPCFGRRNFLLLRSLVTHSSWIQRWNKICSN